MSTAASARCSGFNDFLQTLTITARNVISKMCAIIKWPFDRLALLMWSSRSGIEPGESDVIELRKLSVLVPTRGVNSLTLDDLRQECVKITSVPSTVSYDTQRAEMLEAIFQPPYRWTDDDVQVVWPARCKKDLSLRRLRFRDVFTAFEQAGELCVLRKLCNLVSTFDYIAVVNMSFCVFLFGWEWACFWRSVGAFNSPGDWLVAARFVNDRIKRTSVLSFPRGQFVEAGTLLGYRNPPFPGFDVLEEARDLADGGDPHGLELEDLAPDYQRNLSSLAMVPHQIEWVSFHDYVVSGDWQTSGSSSVGKVKWSWGDESGKFKARKNLVPDVVDLEALYEECVSSTKQINKTLIKAELGKIRLAVSSDLQTYLKMDWLSRYMTHAYKSWPGSTMEESIEQQTQRQADMLSTIRSSWNLPFDFRGFDHQPTTSELKAQWSYILGCVRPSIDLGNRPEFDNICANVLDSMDNAVLRCTDGDKTTDLHIAGGLMSGLRWTSLTGNGWNTTMTQWVTELMDQLLVCYDKKGSWLRGDDSALSFGSWMSALLFRLGYMSIGADGADGKFGIMFGASEFLRTWYSSTGLSGYALRTIPSLTQRKPWAPQPWQDESTLAHVYDAIRILRRRVGGQRVEALWYAVKTTWSRRKRVTQAYLQVPKPRGLGIEPWDGVTTVATPYSSTPTSDLTVETNGYTERLLRCKQVLQSYPLSDVQYANLAQAQLRSKLTSDDVPAVNSSLRDHTTVTATRAIKAEPLVMPMCVLNAVEAESLSLAITPASGSGYAFASEQPAGYGQFRWLAAEFDDRKLAQSELGGSALQDMFKLYPEFESAVRSRSQMGFKRSEAVSWLIGDVSVGVLSRVHPMIAGVVASGVLRVVSKLCGRYNFKGRLSSFLSYFTQYLEPSVFRSPLSRELYMW